MKLTIFLLLFSNIYFSQYIPDRTNAIVVRTRLPNSEACQKLVDLLRQQNWKLDQQDHRFTAFVTEYKPGKNDRSIRLVTTVKQGIVLLRGESLAPGVTKSSYPTNVVYNGQDDPVNFEVMNQLALCLKAMIPGSSIDYIAVTE